MKTTAKGLITFSWGIWHIVQWAINHNTKYYKFIYKNIETFSSFKISLER